MVLEQKHVSLLITKLGAVTLFAALVQLHLRVVTPPTVEFVQLHPCLAELIAHLGCY